MEVAMDNHRIMVVAVPITRDNHGVIVDVDLQAWANPVMEAALANHVLDNIQEVDLAAVMKAHMEIPLREDMVVNMTREDMMMIILQAAGEVNPGTEIAIEEIGNDNCLPLSNTLN
jgi:hypothetical protein